MYTVCVHVCLLSTPFGWASGPQRRVVTMERHEATLTRMSLEWALLHTVPRGSVPEQGAWKSTPTTITCLWTRYWFGSISFSVYTWDRNESLELLFWPRQNWDTIKKLKSNWLVICSTQAHCCPRNICDWIKICDLKKKKKYIQIPSYLRSVRSARPSSARDWALGFPWRLSGRWTVSPARKTLSYVVGYLT